MLCKLVEDENFKRELDRGAEISSEGTSSHFSVYLGKNLESIMINEAVPVKTPAPGDESALPMQCELGNGNYAPVGSYTLIRVLFQLPGQSAIPRQSEVEMLSQARSQNDSISEVFDSSSSAYRLYANPVQIIGHVLPENKSTYEIVGFQGVKRGLNFDGLIKKAERHFQMQGKHFDRGRLAEFGFGGCFTDPREFVDFMNSTRYYKAFHLTANTEAPIFLGSEYGLSDMRLTLKSHMGDPLTDRRMF